MVRGNRTLLVFRRRTPVVTVSIRLRTTGTNYLGVTGRLHSTSSSNYGDTERFRLLEVTQYLAKLVGTSKENRVPFFLFLGVVRKMGLS